MPLVTKAAQSSTTQTATGNSSTVLTASQGNVGLTLRVTSATGTTPSMTLAVQWSADGTNFGAADTADAFTAVTTTGVVSKAFTTKAQFYRVAWTISGTSPSFTFTVDAVEYSA